MMGHVRRNEAEFRPPRLLCPYRCVCGSRLLFAFWYAPLSLVGRWWFGTECPACGYSRVIRLRQYLWETWILPALVGAWCVTIVVGGLWFCVWALEG